LEIAPDFSGINSSGNPEIEKSKSEIISRGAAVWSPECLKTRLDFCWNLHLIYSGAGMTEEREQESEIICRRRTCVVARQTVIDNQQ